MTTQTDAELEAEVRRLLAPGRRQDGDLDAAFCLIVLAEFARRALKIA